VGLFEVSGYRSHGVILILAAKHNLSDQDHCQTLMDRRRAKDKVPNNPQSLSIKSGREWRLGMAFVLQGEYQPPLSIVGMRTKSKSPYQSKVRIKSHSPSAYELVQVVSTS